MSQVSFPLKTQFFSHSPFNAAVEGCNYRNFVTTIGLKKPGLIDIALPDAESLTIRAFRFDTIPKRDVRTALRHCAVLSEF